MKPTPECIALLRSIAAAPDDDMPRLVFADWLDENSTSDADVARAEYIRLSCKMKPKTRLNPGEGKWLDENVHRLWPSVTRKLRPKSKLKSIQHMGGGWVHIASISSRPKNWGIGWIQKTAATHIFLYVLFQRGFAHVAFHDTYLNGACFKNIGLELALDEPFVKQLPMDPDLSLDVQECPGTTGALIYRCDCCGEEAWNLLEGFSEIRTNDACKFFAFDGETEDELDTFRYGVLLPAIMIAMTKCARQKTGWPIDWTSP